MHSLDDIEISLCLSFEKAGIILTVKYYAKISVLKKIPNYKNQFVIPGPGLQCSI